MNEYLQIAIGAMILGLVLWSAYRHGAGNPESTGRLSRKFADLDKKLSAMAAHSADRDSRYAELDAKVNGIADDMVTRADIDALRKEIAGDRSLAERTWHAVNRLESFFIERGIHGNKSGDGH